MTAALQFNGDAIRESLRSWSEERDTLDTELQEALAALAAYQSHLDSWQQQLAGEREQLERDRHELQSAREQFERDRTTADKNRADTSAAATNELHAAHEKITALTTLLLSRTEELRTLDNRRAEVQTELELARARERELKASLDEHKRQAEQDREAWSEELKQLRGMLSRQFEAPADPDPTATTASESASVPPATTAPAARSAYASTTTKTNGGGGARVLPRENAVLGSIVEQFGKLRQQRAVERQATQRPR